MHGGALDIIIPGPEIESDPDHPTALWDQTGNFIGTALARNAPTLLTTQ
jgi:hypothetical protein